ncbi:type VI secretion system ImpA family N-terminal domain-containing protein, partial [Pseudomonas chlororaphis]
MSYSSKLSAHYLELAKASISKESFAGEDVRFSSEYEALESELGKAQSMHESGQIDWLKILENSEALLRTQSKDLRVAAWLTWALYQRESFPGLLAGFGLLQHLCEQHWAQIH